MASRSEVRHNGGHNRQSHSLDERPLVHFFKIILPPGSMASREELARCGGHRRSHSQAEMPLMHFFKIILASTLEDKKLRFPGKFVRRFGEELSDVANIVVPSGHAWKIGLTKDQSNIWFDEGWQKFVELHSISYGYLLLFAYIGCSNFNVFIFDISACEIQYPCIEPTSGNETDYGRRCSFNHEDEMEDKDSIEILDSTISSSKKNNASAEKNLGTKMHHRCLSGHRSENLEHFSDKSSKKPMKEKYPEITNLEDANVSWKGKLIKNGKSRPCQFLFSESKDKVISATIPEKNELCEEDSEMIASGFKKASLRSQRAIQAAKTIKHENPSFMVILRAFNIHKGFAYVPSGFARRYMREVPEYVRLQISDGREWAVRFSWNGYRRLRLILTKGWSRFYRENNLVEGDVCVFELINDDSSMLTVSVFRLVDHYGCRALQPAGLLDKKMAPRKEGQPTRSFHRRSHSQAEQRPLWHFFKIITQSTLKDKKLRIPNKFVRKFGEELSEVAKVFLPNGHSWQIALTKANNSIWFDDGWLQFVEHHSIGYGHLLVFGYRGYSNFHALIFDKTACEIRYQQCRGETSGEKIDYDEKCSLYDLDVMENEGSIESIDSQYCCALESGVVDENAGESSKRHPPMPPSPENNAQGEPHFEHSNDKRGKIPVKKEHIIMADLDGTNESMRRNLSKKCRLSRPNGSLIDETKINKGKSKTKFDETELPPQCGEDMEIVVSGFAKASKVSKKAIHAARMFKPKNPSFMVLLRSYNKCFVSVPAEFAKRHLSGVSEYIKLQVSDGRQWPIRLNKTRSLRLTISKGWNEFQRENNLKEGDVCVFELIKNNKSSPSLQVSMNVLASKEGKTGTKSSITCKRDLRYLRIPELFVRSYGNKISDPAEVFLPDGRVWPLGITKGDKDIWFQDGFDKFLQHYLIRQRNLLVFFYTGNSNFNVRIFDTSSCEIQYPHYGLSSSKNVQDLGLGELEMKDDDDIESSEDDDDVESSEYDDDVESSEDDEFEEKSNKKKSCTSLQKPRSSCHRKVKTEDDNEMVVNCEKETSTPGLIKKAHQKTLTNTYTHYRPENYIPIRFAREHVGRDTKRLKVKDVSGKKEWPVGILWRHIDNKDAYLFKGWRQFLEDNQLKAGDVCGFELMKSEEGVVLQFTKVHSA
ncbi:unnamed protein product [Dovyalis caffra]|uniref:TF-B3 domain-containing protein n=1 Tax=Dovyalis caffra TaxID=77055 RepID=A0AAV1R9V3_9ROSI|nr:unnamed protein product [Dovyalis caffra]